MSDLNNIANERIKILLNRNLYVPEIKYEDRDLIVSPKTYLNNFADVNEGGFADAINNTLPLIKPLDGIMSFTSKIFSRLENTKLMMIANRMYAQHMLYNAASLTSAKYSPQIKLGNIFDKDNKIFNMPIDNSITKTESSTGIGKFVDIVKDTVDNAILTNTIFDKNPFSRNISPDSAVKELIDNTGDGQFGFLVSSIGRNYYRSDDDVMINRIDEIDDSGFTLKTTYIDGKIFYSFNKKKFNPYSPLTYQNLDDAVTNANKSMIESKKHIYIEAGYEQYAPDLLFVENYFGESVLKSKSKLGSEWIGDDTDEPFNQNNIDNQIVWGRDSISKGTNEHLNKLRDESISDEDIDTSKLNYKFNVRSGLLEYTRNLLNATEGRIIDNTKKIFTDGDGNINGYQGSPLYKTNNSSYADKSDLREQGLRQHTIIDQYNNKAKAIRYNGNNVYEGNENSVLYKSVLPKIHPTRTDEGDYRRMMFSLENLAVNVLSKDDSYGIIDDEYGTLIPRCEVGPTNGRIMWFPPYNLEINESTNNKFESTVMVGRNEPMYNYMNSERSATIRFSLLMDYPEQLNNFIGQNKHKDISEFFAFGGDSFNRENLISNIEEEINRLKKQNNDLNEQVDVSDAPDFDFPVRTFYFPNNEPSNDNIDNVFNEIYNDWRYELSDKTELSELKHPTENIVYGKSGTTYGLNEAVLWIPVNYVYKYGDNLINFSEDFVNQYNTDDVKMNYVSPFNFNIKLQQFADDENISNNYTFELTVGTSKLGSEDFNKKLADRRVSAVKKIIKERLSDMGYNKDVKFEVVEEIIGDSDLGASPNNINLKDVKKERFVRIKPTRIPDTIELEDPNLTEDDKNIIEQNNAKIAELEKELERMKKESGCVMMNDRDEVFMDGFKSVSGNYFKSAFHSQTPEDYHKRLTFLQQCCRQGSAKRSSTMGADGELRARNSVFGRQPICVLRIGDFFYTKVIIESLTIDYNESPWDLNPEGFGVQPMIANITLNLKVMGGQSLKGPINALQNAVSYNHYANSNFSNKGIYKLPSAIADKQYGDSNDLDDLIKSNKEYRDNNN